jgi:hypothetical protein
MFYEININDEMIPTSDEHRSQILSFKLELISSGTTKIELEAQRSSQLAYALH